MKIKTWTSREDAISLLKNRNLNLNNSRVDEILKTTNYYLLVNGLESLFLKTPQVHTYNQNKNYNNKYYFEQFEIFYNFDRELSDSVFNSLGDFEEKLKTAVAYNFCKNHCQTLEKTMEYTNQDNYVDPGTRGSNYPFLSEQNKYLSSKFIAQEENQKFVLFKENYLKKLVVDNDNIDKDKYTDTEYFPLNIQKVARYFVNRRIRNTYRKRYDDQVAVPFWVAIQKMSLGTLNILCHFLSDSDLKDVMSDFNILNDSAQNRDVFLNCLDLLVELRNNCAHGELITRFRTSKKVHINNLISQKLSFFCYNTNQTTPSKIALYDAIQILSMFSDVTNIGKIFKRFKYNLVHVNSSLRGKGSKGRKKSKDNQIYSMKLFDTLLYRIGKTGTNQYHPYKDWKKFKTQNFLFDDVFS